MMDTRTSRVALRLTVALVAMLLAGGCGGPRVATEPLTPSELDRVATAVDATAQSLTALRAGGTGTLSTSDQRSPFDFTVVYDQPGWLRGDLRPSSPAVPSGFAAYLRVADECADLLFPASLVMVTGCLEEAPFADPALLLFGVISGDDIRALETAMIAEDDDAVRLTGRRDEMQIDIGLDRETMLLTNIEIRADDEAWLTIEYEGNGWKRSMPLPQTTIVKFGRMGRTQARLKFDFERLRAIDAVDRNALDLVVPPGTVVSTWGDLALWR